MTPTEPKKGAVPTAPEFIPAEARREAFLLGIGLPPQPEYDAGKPVLVNSTIGVLLSRSRQQSKRQLLKKLAERRRRK